MAYETVLLSKPEVFIYNIPPRASSTRAVRAADWNLASPDWTGKMRITTLGQKVTIKLEEKETGELFAACPVETFPSIAVEAVSDSSRYFVLRLQDSNGRYAFVGMGFQDRGDSFDFNVTLQDHFNREKKAKDFEGKEDEPVKLQDLRLKEGQTIKINLGNTQPKTKTSSTTGSGSVGLLPPPPGGSGAVRTIPPPSQAPSQPLPMAQTTKTSALGEADDWSDFFSARSETSSSSSSNTTQSGSGGDAWVKF